MGCCGRGSGGLKLTPVGSGPAQADIDLSMAAAGARGALPGMESLSLDLAIEIDAMWLPVNSEAAPGLDATESDVTRLRFGMEGSRKIALENGGTMAPRVEIGMRQDGGDAKTGVSADFGGGIAFSDASASLAVQVSGRAPNAHADGDHRDWGLSGVIAFGPDPDSRRGLLLSLRQTAGEAASGGVDATRNRETIAGIGRESGAVPEPQPEVEAEYGLSVLGGGMIGAPHAGLALSGAGQTYTLGWRIGPERSYVVQSFDLDLAAQDREGLGGGPEEQIGLGLPVNW